MNREYSVDLLIDYAEGLLDSETSAAISASRIEDPEMSQTLDGIESFLKDHNNDRDAMEKWLQKSQKPLHSVKGNEVRPTKSKPLFRSRFIVLAAASILVAVSLIWVFNSESDVDFLAAASSEHYALPNYRSDENPTERVALTYYENKDYNKALSAFQSEALSNKSPLNTFALGMCYFYNGRFEEARQTLQEKQVQNSRLAERANWFSALSAWNLSECTDAELLLIDLQNTELSKEAKEALTALGSSTLCAKE